MGERITSDAITDEYAKADDVYVAKTLVSFLPSSHGVLASTDLEQQPLTTAPDYRIFPRRTRTIDRSKATETVVGEVSSAFSSPFRARATPHSASHLHFDRWEGATRRELGSSQSTPLSIDWQAAQHLGLGTVVRTWNAPMYTRENAVGATVLTSFFFKTSAIGFSYFEHLVNNGDQQQLFGEVARITSFNTYLLNIGGYDRMLFEDMVDETIGLLRDLADSI